MDQDHVLGQSGRSELFQALDVAGYEEWDRVQGQRARACVCGEEGASAAAGDERTNKEGARGWEGLAINKHLH